jgi:hypothetical protein
LFFEIDCDNSCGPGLDSIFPTSSIKWSVKSKNNAFTFGFRPWSKRRQTKKKRTSEVSSKYVQISISPNNKRSTQSASVEWNIPIAALYSSKLLPIGLKV